MLSEILEQTLIMIFNFMKFDVHSGKIIIETHSDDDDDDDDDDDIECFSAPTTSTSHT